MQIIAKFNMITKLLCRLETMHHFLSLFVTILHTLNIHAPMDPLFVTYADYTGKIKN